MMSLRAYAKRRGVTPMAVSFAVKAGRLKASVTRDENGQPKIADPELADREWAENTDLTRQPTKMERSEELSPPADEGSLGKATERQKHWMAKLAELKYQQQTGELVPAKDVSRKLADVFQSCRTKLMGLPTRARQALPHLPAADVAVLESLVREALEGLANGEFTP